MSEIYKFIKNSKGEKIGALLGTTIDSFNSGFAIGYSLCNTKLDKFDKNKALTIARGRALKANKNSTTMEIPRSIAYEFESFAIRCGKYFK